MSGIDPEDRADPPEWDDFAAAARRLIEQHIRIAFIRTYTLVLDDETYRSFNSMEEYRRWCKENVPDWLGYHRARVPVTRFAVAGGGAKKIKDFHTTLPVGLPLTSGPETLAAIFREEPDPLPPAPRAWAGASKDA